MASLTNFDIYRGADAVFELILERGTTPVDLTSCKLYHTAKVDYADSDGSAIWQYNTADDVEFQITDAVNGKAQFIITHDVTLSITQDKLYYDVKLIDADSIETILISGAFTIKQPVTDALT